MACRAVVGQATRGARQLTSRLLAARVRNLSAPASKDRWAEDEDYIVYPRERAGLQYELNWSLNGHDITPQSNAYQNPDVKLLLSKLGTKPESGNTVSLQSPAGAGSDTKVVEAGGDSLSFASFDQLFEQVTGYFSSGKPELFVTDGTVGSAEGASVGVRVITDDPGFSLVINNLLSPRKSTGPSRQPVTVYLATGLQTSDTPVAAVQYEEEEKGGIEGAAVIITGKASQTTLMSAVFKAVSGLWLEQEGPCPLPAAVVGPRSGGAGKAGLVFGLGPEDVASLLSSGNLLAAHHSVWSPSGLSAFWGGAIAKASQVGPPSPSPVVGGLVTLPHTTDTVVPTPTGIYFIKQGGTTKLSKDALKQHLVEAGLEEDSLERLEGLVTKNNTPAYTVGSAKAAVDALSS